MILRIVLDLPEDAAYVSMARHISRSVLEHMKVVPIITKDIEFMVGELASNAVRHAPDNGYQVEMEYHAEQVFITVTDKGQGFSFADVPPPGTIREDTAEEDRLGGWGLPMVQQLSDRLQFFRTDPHGTTVRAEKKLLYQSNAAAEEADDMEKNNDLAVGAITTH